ncbi:hypothetical protein [Silvanigrella sp.]|jgi:hypothetical protein|uniref:hypothetical protein n=1 Tax=Silvanigrella sp. TaxID=2024976 RepID=UPI0037C5DD13|nr:hypothetical protein [Silvanigrellaceae bacterium]
MAQIFKNQKNLEQSLRRKKLDKPGKHAFFLLSLFNQMSFTQEQDFSVIINREEFLQAGLISDLKHFENWKNKMISLGIFILNNNEENLFKPSSFILNYIYKEKNLPIEMNNNKNSSALEENLKNEIKNLQEEILLLKEALKETNRRIERAAESWKLRSTFVLKKENERQVLNTFPKRF